jgi:hypothetical protein
MSCMSTHTGVRKLCGVTLTAEQVKQLCETIIANDHTHGTTSYHQLSRRGTRPHLIIMGWVK